MNQVSHNHRLQEIKKQKSPKKQIKKRKFVCESAKMKYMEMKRKSMQNRPSIQKVPKIKMKINNHENRTQSNQKRQVEEIKELAKVFGTNIDSFPFFEEVKKNATKPVVVSLDYQKALRMELFEDINGEDKDLMEIDE